VQNHSLLSLGHAEKIISTRLHQARLLGKLARRKHKDKHVRNMSCQEVSLTAPA